MVDQIDCDIIVKRYDPAKTYDNNIKTQEEYRIPLVVNIKTQEEYEAAFGGVFGDLAAGQKHNEVRCVLHSFSYNLLGGGADDCMDKFQGSDSYGPGGDPMNPEGERTTIILYVRHDLPEELVEDLVIALTEEFGVPETADAR